MKKQFNSTAVADDGHFSANADTDVRISRIYEWTPEIILATLKNYSLGNFLSDLKAGILVSVVAFPLFMTFSIASGVAPNVGIMTCIVAGSLACLLGGARFQIVGPTGAFAMIVADIIKTHGFEGMTCALIMAGIMMILLGIAKVGDLIHYVPYPITAGFTAGIGLSIIVAQLGTFLGLTLPRTPIDFFDKISCYVGNLGAMNFYSFGLAVFSLLLLATIQKYRPKLPGYFIVLVLGIGYSLIFDNVGVETIGSKFGDVASRAPSLAIPGTFFSFSHLRVLFPAAFAIAFLGSLESLLGAIISDNLSGEKHRSNMELVGQGIANLGSALCGGIPATCALGTTSLNVRVGGKTPIAGLFNVLFILLFMLCLGQFVKIIPMSSLAAMMLYTAWNMAGFTKNKYILLAPKSDIIVFISTVLITLLTDIVVAVEVGLVLSAFLFIKRSVETTTAETFSRIITTEECNGKECECVRVSGHIFFGAAPLLHHALEALPKVHDTIYIDMQNVPFIDVTGAKVLKEFVAEVKCKNIEVFIGGLNKRTMKALKKMDIANELAGHLSENRI
ncbi:MAG: STAS domain-containing protein [Holosporaceae bacterium]|jgi:SulP family sulfate permease|nr:STAS domain-containing protein [Holosporaceae bacterium]